MTRNLQPGHLSQLSLDLLLLGELGEDTREARRHIDECLACRKRYETMRDSYQHFERHVHFRTAPRVVGEARGNAESVNRHSRWIAAIATTVAAAAVPLLWIRSSPPLANPATGETAQRNGARDRGEDEQNGTLLTKGGPEFVVYARQDGRVFPVENGARLKPGDALRFTAEPSGYSFLMIASVDAVPKATIYFPYLGIRSALIAPQQHFADSGSIVLDGTPGPERIFALFSNRPLDAEIVKRALAAIGERGGVGIRDAISLDVGSDFQTSILIEK